MNPKENAAKYVIPWIQDGMVIGLGSGSTSAYFIELLGMVIREQGLHIRGVATSRASAQLAAKHNIPLIDLNDVPRIDITIDGADEIDPQKRLIKGHGGAHVREKIVASCSRELVIIADQSKLVERLGKKSLPVEVLSFGSTATRAKIELLGYRGSWRLTPEKSPVITDNGNMLFDIHFTDEPELVHERLRALPGVVDTGFFFGLAGRIVIGYEDGRVDLL